MQQIDLSDLATKADLAATIAELRSELKLDMAEMKTELIKWVLGIGFAQVAAIVTLLKLLPGGHP